MEPAEGTPAPARVTRATTRSALTRLQPLADSASSSTTTSRTVAAAKKRVEPPLQTPSSHKVAKTAAAATPRSPGGTKLECVICMDALGADGGVLELGCKHSFCRACVATHIARQQRYDLTPSCALCKQALSDAEVEAAGDPNEEQEQSEKDESEGMMVLVFEGEDGEEQGFWVQFDPNDDDDDDDDDEGEEEDDENQLSHIFLEESDQEENDADGAGGARAARRRRRSDGERRGDGEGEEEQPEDLWGGWRWSASHNAWVGSHHCTLPPPTAPPDSWDGPDPLEGRWLVEDDEEDDDDDYDDVDEEVYNAIEEDELNELAEEEAHEYWGARDDEI